jgi:hypothetical protein
MSMGWIAEHLSTPNAANASQQIRRNLDLAKDLPKPPKT